MDTNAPQAEVCSSAELGPATTEAKRVAAFYQQNPEWFGDDEIDELCRLIDKAVAAERERCLRIVRAVNNYDNPMTANDCADMISSGREYGEY